LTHTRLNTVAEKLLTSTERDHGNLPHAPHGSQGLRPTSYQHSNGGKWGTVSYRKAQRTGDWWVFISACEATLSGMGLGISNLGGWELTTIGEEGLR